MSQLRSNCPAFFSVFLWPNHGAFTIAGKKAGNPRKQFRVERLSGSDGGDFAGRNHGDVKNMVLSRKINDIG